MKKFLAKYKLRTEDILIVIPDKIEAKTVSEAFSKAKSNRYFDRSEGWVLLFIQEVESMEDIWGLL